jgi:hypothetical protein
MLEARKNGQLAKALAWRQPGESQEELDRLTSEPWRRVEKGLVRLRSEEGELSYKYVEELSPEDRMDRIRAELARIEWLLERQGRRNIIFGGISSGSASPLSSGTRLKPPKRTCETQRPDKTSKARAESGSKTYPLDYRDGRGPSGPRLFMFLTEAS